MLIFVGQGVLIKEMISDHNNTKLIKKKNSLGLLLFIGSPVESRDAAVTRNCLYKALYPI